MKALYPHHAGQLMERQVWQGAIEFHVEEPWFSSGPRATLVKTVAWLLTAAGSVVSLPFLLRCKPGDIEASSIERVPRVSGVKDGRPVLEDGRVLDVANVI